MRIFGVSLLTIVIVLAAFYIGRRTGFLTGLWAPLTS
jgi:hypothetical protein